MFVDSQPPSRRARPLVSRFGRSDILGSIGEALGRRPARRRGCSRRHRFAPGAIVRAGAAVASASRPMRASGTRARHARLHGGRGRGSAPPVGHLPCLRLLAWPGWNRAQPANVSWRRARRGSPAPVEKLPLCASRKVDHVRRSRAVSRRRPAGCRRRSCAGRARRARRSLPCARRADPSSR